MRDYADKFVDTYSDWQSVIKREFDNDVAKYREARRRSYETNMQRFNQGFAMTGSMIPNNATVDRNVEFGLLRQFNNQQKRLIWYGINAY